MMIRSTALTVLAASWSFILAPVSAAVLLDFEDVPDTADFVIVGGGTAGCVLASRLCRDLPQAKIVLLERGPPRNQAEDLYVSAPRFGEAIYGNAGPEGVGDVFKYFPSEPNSNLVDPATGNAGRIFDLLDGASIGGASNVAFQWSYPLAGTVDEWGINGLDTAKANALFERVADVIKPAQPPPELRQDYYEDVLDAYSKFNYTIKDKQIPGEGGFTAELNFITFDEAGRRRSSYTQYLLPVLNFICENSLQVIQDVTITKLKSSTEDKGKIDTVEFVSSSIPTLSNTIMAKQEILLSAGPYGSPKLLLQSGIGPSEDLASKGISPIVADLPVGQRTQLRPLVGAVGRYSGRPLARFANTSLLTERAARQFARGKGGPFGVAMSATLGKRDKLGYHTTSWGLLGTPDEPYFSMYCFLNPVSFGNLTVADSANPLADPIVHTNLLGEPEDFQEALKCAEDFREIIRDGFPEDFGMVEFGPSESLPTQDWVASASLTSWHFVGGSAVGSVVDGDLKLLGGLTGVRVIDASVIPKLTVSAGVLSSVYMLAEFASDKLVEEYSPLLGPPDVVEVFPVAFSMIMLFVAVVFTAWVVVSNTSRPSGQEDTEVKPRLDKRSFWVTNPVRHTSFRGTSEGLTSKATVKRFYDYGYDITVECEEEVHAGVPKDVETAKIVSSEPSVLLSWSQVTCSYPSSNASDPSFTSLRDSFGEMRSRELTAIMGGSGSGKSTLLDILSGRKTLGDIEGKMSVLGEVLDNIREQTMDEAGALRSIAAYVPQQEAFFPTQTAEEAVAFVANLKLGKDARGDDVRWSRIQSVLREVGLSPETCKRPIGGELAGGVVIRGLSGGERKRLAVACALALKPRLLFLDEITSGLDSENALAITKLLKRKCLSRNVAAMMVIHQPNGALFREFDRLVLLSKVKPIFSDDTSKLPDLYRDIFEAPMPDWHAVPSDLMAQIADLSNEGAKTTSGAVKELVPTTRGPREEKHHLEPPGAFWKFKTVFQRNLMNHYVRNLTNLASRLVFYGATSVIDGLLFWQVGNMEGGVSAVFEINTVVGALTFIIMVSYLLPFAMIPIFVKDKKFFLAESALGLYSPWLYCLSQIILETWVIVLAATIEACIVVPMCGLWNPAMDRWESFYTFLGALIVSGLTGSVLVLFHAMVLPSQDLAFLLGSGVVTISLALSGGFIPFPAMEDFISWLQWISPCKYTLQALALAFFKGTTYEALVNEVYAFDSPPTVSGNIGVLIAFFGAFAGGTMFALSRQREVR